MKLPLILTPGDPDGIGPEVTWKALKAYSRRPQSVPILCVGAAEPFRRLRAPVVKTSLEEFRDGNLPKKRGPFLWLIPAPPGLPGFQAGWSIKTATELVLEGHGRALITGPISKERLQAGGYKYSGHTDFLADLCEVPSVTMMLANEQLRVSLVTVHVGIAGVPRAVTALELRRAVQQTVHGLQSWWGIRKPRIAIAALNPHAGEGGMFGREEIETIIPTIDALSQELRRSTTLVGPLPADTLFANHISAPKKERFDAVICMYHDQGLIPVKLLDFYRTVNVTMGLPIVRTSVDHGVAFDIAGKNRANFSSMESAIELAVRLTRKRH